MFKEYQKILIAIVFCAALYLFFCKCFEKYDPFDPFTRKQQNVSQAGNEKIVNAEDIETSSNGCGQDPMFVSSDLLPKTEQTGENYFEGLNVPVDATSVELPLERQFYSTGNNRNANLGLRAEPPNPQEPVGPWLQSTIMHDDSKWRRPLDCNDA